MDREDRVVVAYGREHASAVLDLLELVELAWHDCYAEISPSEDVVDDILLLGEGDLGKLIAAARVAVMDWRDSKVAADQMRDR